MLSGNDSLLSIVQMPKGVPVATVAIHNAANAGLLAARTIGAGNRVVLDKMQAFLNKQEDEVLAKSEKLEKIGHAAYLQQKGA
jgi:phosphoribosylaminoimidazole carboxylase